MNRRSKTYWRATAVAVIAVSALSFTPVVLDPVDAEPWFLGMPHTLWASMFVAVALVVLAWVGTRAHEEADDEVNPR
ncbi:MAG TPA: hypothetical protein VF190_15610 [Rhodothermales bacterium]